MIEMENKSEITGLTQTQSPGRVGQFKTRLVKPLMRFLTMPYIRAQRILQLARTVDIFHMQSIYLARQALHLVILLNDSVDVADGPDDEQYEERNDLEDELIELFYAMKNWGANHDDKEEISSVKRVLQIKQCYTVLFRERFYFQNSRDHSNDPTYQRILAYDEKTIKFRAFQNHGPKSAPVDLAHPNYQIYSHKQRGDHYVEDQNDLDQKQRRNAIQPHVRPVTVPSGKASQRQFSEQQQQHPERGDDLALRYHREEETERQPRSRPVYGSGRIPVGQSVATTGPARTSRMRHSRRGSNTGAAVITPLMNTNPPSPTPNGSVAHQCVTSTIMICDDGMQLLDPPAAAAAERRRGYAEHGIGWIARPGHSNDADGFKRAGRSRPKRHDISDAPRHARRISRSQSVLMAAATTQLSMDTNPMWNAQPLFDGRGMRYDSANMVISETPAGLAPYAYDAGRPHLSYLSEPPEAVSAGFPAPGTSENGGRLNHGISAPSPDSIRPTIGFAGSLQRSPASTTADPHLDSQVYSHNQHDKHYEHIAPGSQYAQEFDYTQHEDSMSSNLQQHAEDIYTSESHTQYYHSSHSLSPASPTLPLRSSPNQALYHQSYASPSLAANPFTIVDDIVKLNQASYLPPQKHHPQSRLSAPPSPSEMSEPPERHSPTLQGRSRVPGQRVDIDGKMLENSFRGNDDQSRVRRQVLDDILRQPWFHSNQDEPKLDVHLHQEIMKHGLGTVGRSIYTVFLVEDKESNQWRCLFGSDEMSCKKSEKRFERVERAIEHVRSHLGHRPFACDGTCHKSKSTGINCGKRFFAAGYLEDHKKRPQKRGYVP